MKRNIVVSIIAIVISIMLSAYMYWNVADNKEKVNYSADMTLKEVSMNNEIKVNELLHILSHKNRNVWSLPLNVPIKILGMNNEDVQLALEHIKQENRPIKSAVKYVLWSIWFSIIIIFVLTRKKIKKTRIIILLSAVIIFGVILGAVPNPMESTVKYFKMLNNMGGNPKELTAAVILFSLFSLLGNKIMCSWGCHLGALQESIFNLPVFKNKYKVQLPFSISLSVRILLFAVFIFLLFGFGAGITSGSKYFVIYHHLNYFKMFEPNELAVFALYSLPVFILCSLFVYRPFCQLVCPFGLYAWCLENVAINKIQIIRDKCIQCQLCVKICPTEAMKAIYQNKRKYLLPDCWSCGRCVEVCPEDAIVYGSNKELIKQ